jgi:polysaccharide biosynthesis transport protein
LAFLLEYLDNTLKTPEEVEHYLRLPNLGIVPDFLSLEWQRYGPQKLSSLPPRMPSSLASGKEPALVLSHHSFSVVKEAYRTLRTAILLSRAGESPKTILFTSGIRGEGKTVTVLTALLSLPRWAFLSWSSMLTCAALTVIGS